jgi:pimeloyl-ACP methyl ester carboxylesterase
MSRIAPFTHAGATLIAEQFGVDAADDASPTYVLIHGIGMGRSIFADLVERLAPARTIAIDLPGYGEAPEPPRVLTMERSADLLAAFLRDRDIGPVVVIGHSMGTQVAVEVAARHPQLVDRVVLIGPTVDRAERTALQQLLRLAQDLLIESPRVIFLGAREYVRAGPHLRAKFRAMLVHRPEDTYPRVHVPVLVLRGAHDDVCSDEWCRFVTDALPDGTLAEIENHGHETMIRDAAPAAALVREFVGSA